MNTIKFHAMTLSIFFAGTLPITGWAAAPNCRQVFESIPTVAKSFTERKEVLTEALRAEAEQIAYDNNLSYKVFLVESGGNTPAMWNSVFQNLGPAHLSTLFKSPRFESEFGNAKKIISDDVRREAFREFLETYLNFHMKESPVGYHNLTQIQTAQFLDILLRKQSFAEFMRTVEYVVTKKELPDMTPDLIGDVIRKINAPIDNFALPGQIPRKLTFPVNEFDF